MSRGWVKLHRDLLRSELWKKPNDLRLFLWILLQADAKTGRLDASLRFIAKGFADEGGKQLHIEQIRRMLKRLERRGSIAVQQIRVTECVTESVTQTVTRLTVINWARYQWNQQGSVTKSVTESVTESVTNTRSKKKERTLKTNVPEVVQKVVDAYSTKIKASRVTKNSIDKINTRLKEYSVDDLLNAIDNFSASGWWMQHNAHRGLTWFFRSEDQIARFLDLTSETESDEQQSVTLDSLQQSIEEAERKAQALGLT